MLLAEVRTLDDAKEFIRERPELEREDLHMLGLIVGAKGYQELLALVEQLDIPLVGGKGR